MRMLTLVALAASAAFAAPVLAQTVPDQDYGMPPRGEAPPPPHMRQGPPPGTTWHSNGPVQMQMRAPMAAQQQQMQQRYMVRHMGPGQAMGGQRRHFEFHRIDRGGVVPNRWWGPQFQVRNWRMYGFPQPFAGGRWIRYYDDALLIDGYGRVYDSRPGWDWDRYGDSWAYDDEGVPFYGDEDEDYRSERYEHAERYDGRDMGPPPGVRQRVYVQQAPMPMAGPPPLPCARVCGGGYGYGYGYGYGAPVLVTETTVTEAPVVEQRTIVTYETVRVPVKHHRRHVVRCGCRRAPPPSYGGERG